MDKAKSTLSIEVEGDTTKLQQQLRAIAKHVGALADELDRIDATNVYEHPTEEE